MLHEFTTQERLHHWIFDKSDLMDRKFTNEDLRKSPVLDGLAEKTKLDYSRQVISQMVKDGFAEKLPRHFFRIK